MNSARGPSMAFKAECVCFLAADAVFLRYPLSGHAHEKIIVHVPESVVKHGVSHRQVAELHSPPDVSDQVGGRAHVFHAAGDDDVRVARFYGLGREHDRLEAGPAHLVDRQGPGFIGDPRVDRGLTGGVLPQTRGEHIAHDDLIDLVRAYARPFHRLCDHQAAETRRGDVLQGPAELADRRPHRADQDNLFRHRPLAACSLPLSIQRSRAKRLLRQMRNIQCRPENPSLRTGRHNWTFYECRKISEKKHL